MSSSKIIIEKSISELRKQKISYEKEVISLDSAICTLENLISKTNIVENVKYQVDEEIKNKKLQRKNRGNGYANRGKITEDSVRDAIIKLIKNPLAEFGHHHKLANGFFTSSQIAQMLGVTENRRIRDILKKFYEKGMLETKPYKRGFQYRYIDINHLPSYKIPDPLLGQQKIARSVPIPGTGKNNTVIRNKDVEKMVAQAKSEGFSVERLGSDHLRISRNGTGRIATISATGRDKARYVENVRSDLKRIGVNV